VPATSAFIGALNRIVVAIIPSDPLLSSVGSDLLHIVN
jgi:hypothetical protein